MKNLIRMLIIYNLLSFGYIAVTKHQKNYFHAQLRLAISERVRLKDSVYKYEKLDDWLLSNKYREEHAVQTILLKLYWEKTYNEDYKITDE